MRGNIEDKEGFCRRVDDTKTKISPNKDSCIIKDNANEDDQTKEGIVEKSVDSSERLIRSARQQHGMSDPKEFSKSRSSSPITDSTPKDLSIAENTVTSQSNPMDMSMASHKSSSIKSSANDSTRKNHLCLYLPYPRYYIYIYIYIFKCINMVSFSFSRIFWICIVSRDKFVVYNIVQLKAECNTSGYIQI